jgi:phenylpropionate dioxygenase-like ring-hydroxylating dioxygenase large terminal subunit
MNTHADIKAVPNDWDRRGLPGWTYHSKALFELERSEIFLRSWQVAGHVNDIPAPGDWVTFDLLGERAMIVRGRDGVIRAFHNLCRHRGARVVDGTSGHCKGALVCPFHGWVYNLDGSLRGAARPETFGDMDRTKFGLKPITLEIWHGFLFIRFSDEGFQPPVAEYLRIYDADFRDHRAEEMLPVQTPGWTTVLPVNWKSVRDVDNEGYHVAMAHPGLQDLYGRTYHDVVHTNGLASSYAEFGDQPGRLWSVRQYVRFAPLHDWLPDRLKRAWNYYGIFPATVFTFTPETVQYYQDIPISPGETQVTGRIYRRPHETRSDRVARYLAYRIDRETSMEDQQLSIWSNESMKSAAFEDFHLSDLEFGVKNHHDQLRKLLPVMDRREAPAEGDVAGINQNLRAVAMS